MCSSDLSARLGARMKPLVVLLPALLVWLLAFEVVAGAFAMQVRYLEADEAGEAMLSAVRWFGWLPFAALFLWARDLRIARTVRG